MGECIEREAVLRAVQGQRSPCRSPAQNRMLDYLKSAIIRIPAADVAPVVRCGNCKHIRPEVDAYTGETVGYWCYLMDFSGIDVDGFCSYGGRKENDDEKV